MKRPHLLYKLNSFPDLGLHSKTDYESTGTKTDS